MSNRFFQSVIIQMKDATDRVIGVIDSDGIITASSELSLIGTHSDNAGAIIEEASEPIVTYRGKTYKSLSGWNTNFDYAVFVDGEDETARCICIMAAVAFGEAKAYYEEKYDKATFVKNIISDNILPGDIYVTAKELRFAIEVPRGVFLIRQVEKADAAVVEALQNMFPDRKRDFILSVNETDTVLIKEFAPGVDSKELMKLATSVEETLTSELGIKTVIGIGTVARHLRELADRFKEVQIAIEVGKVFETEKTIINYENLGIGRLIYQLPTTLCEMFLSEVFKKNSLNSLDQETLHTINKFFENNLNVSETSRKLFVHRNTLVYRLEKIKKLTGLDLREFDHAIIFKVALMVKKYLNSQQSKY